MMKQSIKLRREEVETGGGERANNASCLPDSDHNGSEGCWEWAVLKNQNHLLTTLANVQMMCGQGKQR